jgi:hypothetical protein
MKTFSLPNDRFQFEMQNIIQTAYEMHDLKEANTFTSTSTTTLFTSIIVESTI